MLELVYSRLYTAAREGKNTLKPKRIVVMVVVGGGFFCSVHTMTGRIANPAIHVVCTQRKNIMFYALIN